MLKKQFIVIFLMLLVLIPSLSVKAESTRVVYNQSDLKEALNDASISLITLGSDIKTTEKINVMRPVVIDGNHHTMKYVGTFGSTASSDPTVWGGIYVLQVYKTEATIRNIKLTGGNGGLLINGAKVKLEGTIDVSGNGFGGIELGQGLNVNSSSYLTLDSTTNIVNTTETIDKPTIWVPKDSTNSILNVNGIEHILTAEQAVTLTEIKALQTPQENPETRDTLLGSILLGMTGIVMVVFLAQRKKKLI